MYRSLLFWFFYIGTVISCNNYWAGTAPFCNGHCAAGYHQTQSSKCGEGHCCWSGRKAYCECNVDPVCQGFWSGTAPFCNGGCPAGFYEVATSKSGDGATCLTGYKVACDCIGGGIPVCIPGPNICTGFGQCSDGCKSGICLGCVFSGIGGVCDNSDDCCDIGGDDCCDDCDDQAKIELRREL